MVYHGIKCDELGLSRDLHVNIWVYGNGSQFAKSSDLIYRERINLDLPALEYQVMIESVEPGKFLPSMNLGTVEIPEMQTQPSVPGWVRVRFLS